MTSAPDYTIIWIHIFRMPVFYAMTGFFAALLLQRYGLRRAGLNRFWRIAVPFVGTVSRAASRPGRLVPHDRAVDLGAAAFCGPLVVRPVAHDRRLAG
jgi:hypothetical protein